MIASLPIQAFDLSQRLELEYGWEFITDPSARLHINEIRNSAGWRSARVGLSWNVQFEDLRNYMGAGWYRTHFHLPNFSDTRHVLLKFGAVDYFCEVFLNGFSVGSHEGGYTPFSFEITNAIRPGQNELIVRVIDPPVDEAQNRALFPDMMYNEIPHGKQNWYVQNSGIWQGVRIELCPSLYIERLDVIPGAEGKFQIEARLAGVGVNAENGAIAAATQLEATIYDSDGRRVFHTQRNLANASSTMRLEGVIANHKNWSPDAPHLYSLEVALEGPVQYRRRSRFGFRTLEARDGKLYLNGKPFYMVAALDQDFYPETVHTPTSEEYVREMMTKAKRLGINVLRCHLKVAHPVYLDVADEIGMLIWTELPSWSDCWFPSDHFSTMAAIRAEKMFHEILIRDFNHPCIVIQTIMNESWGINLKDPDQRAWLRQIFDRVKALLAPLGRLVIDNSPCEGNFHIKTDLDDFHQYYSMPDQAQNWDKWLAELAARPAWTFSPYGDAERTGKEPLLVSEFGNWGLPKLPDELPWWFHVNFGDREVTRPAGVLDRFHEFGFDKLFGTFNELAEETQWHQFASLKYEIESIRSYSSIQGYVITGITDVHWEVNGLLDMWRNEKAYAEELSLLQRPDLVMCKLPRHNFYGGERIEIPVILSHYSERDLKGARIRWSTSSGAGTFVISSTIEAGSGAELQPIVLTMPEVTVPTIERLEIEMRLPNGHRVTENSYDLFVLPREKPLDLSLVFTGFESMNLENQFRAINQKNGHQAGNNALMIAGKYDASLAGHLNQGGCAILLVDSAEALPSDWNITAKIRAGSELDGRWFSNYNWIRSGSEPFSKVAFTKILGFEAARVVPDYVLRNIKAEEFNDVLAGITYGWLNQNSALALQMQVGRGKLLVTTFRFSQYGRDPYATALLNSLLRYLSGPECQPKLIMPDLMSTKTQS